MDLAAASRAGSAVTVFEDLSGITAGSSGNPYDALIEASSNDAKQIQLRYETHRTARNDQQKTKLLDPNFNGVVVDPILRRLVDRDIDPDYVDPRHCLVFWARPPDKVRNLVNEIQQRLLSIVPRKTQTTGPRSSMSDTAGITVRLTDHDDCKGFWLLPLERLHLTVLEITHSRTNEEIKRIVETAKPVASEIVDSTFHQRVRLIKPKLGFDASALALTFVPAAGEALPQGRSFEDESITYHHLRRNVYQMCEANGVKVDSRYVVPSAHLTVGRFVDETDLSGPNGARADPEKMSLFVREIEEINAWLQREFWPDGKTTRIPDGGEWMVGEEKGLDFRQGTLWYGGGETLLLGRGY